MQSHIKFFTCLLVVSFLFQLFGQPVSIEKPTVLYHGKFKPAREFSANQSLSANGKFFCSYGFEMQSKTQFTLANLSLYQTDNSIPLAQLKYISASDVDISNAGFMVFYEHPMKEGPETIIHVFSKKGAKLFSRSIVHGNLWGFSPLGTFMGIGTPEKFELLELATGKTTVYPPTFKFAMTSDERTLILAGPKEVSIYKDHSLIGTIPHNLFYIRKVSISPDNKYFAFIGKQQLFTHSLATQKCLFTNELEGAKNSYRDLQFSATGLWVGIAHRDRELRVSRGILKQYSLTGKLLSDETPAERRWEPKRKLNYDYQEKNEYGYQEVPWPFKPFDKADKAWNSYLQLSASSDGNNSGAYAHQGFDMDVPSYAETYSVADKGYVKAVLTTGGRLYWRSAISEVQVSGKSDGWLYAHLVESSIAVDVGDEVKQGDLVGEIIPWNGLPGGHIHFSRLEGSGSTWNGRWRNIANPMFFLRPHGDTQAPEIPKLESNSKFAFSTNDQNSNVQYLKPDKLKGDIDILVKVRDVCGESPWIQAATMINYWVKNVKTGEVVFPKTLALWRGQDMPDYSGSLYNAVDDVIWRISSKYPAKGWFTKERLYVHVITNNDGDSTIERDEKKWAFKTTDYCDGDYRIVVEVKDAAGNTTIDSQDVYFDNGITNTNNPGVSEIHDYAFNGILTDPHSSMQTIHFQIPQSTNVVIHIYDMHGAMVKTLAQPHLDKGAHTVQWDGMNQAGKPLTSGLYLYVFKADNYIASKKLALTR